MRALLRTLASPSMAVAVLALFVAVGGTSYAALSLPPGSVGTKQLKDRAVKTAKIGNGAVTSAKLARAVNGSFGAEVVYNARGTAAGTPTTIGKLGPWLATGSCRQTGTTTALKVALRGPAGRLDGFAAIEGTTAVASDIPIPPNDPDFDSVQSTSTTPFTALSGALLIPTSGTPIQLIETVSATGDTSNSCHASFAVTRMRPTGGRSAATAQSVEPTGTISRLPSSGRSRGAIVAGVPLSRGRR